MMPLIYLVGVCLSFALALAVAVAPFSRRFLEGLGRGAWKLWLLIVLVGVFWFTPWGWAAGWLSGRYDVFTGRFFLYNIPLKLDRGERLAVANELLVRFGVRSRIPSCFRGFPQDVVYEEAYDRVMLQALGARFGSDVFDDCRRSAAKARTALEWIDFYFREARYTPEGLTLEIPAQSGLIMKQAGNGKWISPGDRIVVSKEAEFGNTYSSFQISLMTVEGQEFVRLVASAWSFHSRERTQVVAIAAEGKLVEPTEAQRAAVMAARETLQAN